MESNKKKNKVLNIDISPAPGGVFMNHNGKVIKQHFCQIILTSVQSFLSTLLKVFHIHNYIWWPSFLMNHKRLEQSQYRVTKGTFLLKYTEIGPSVPGQKTLKVFSYRDIRENKPRPLATIFLTNHDCLNNLGTGSPKEHFCQMILKSV